METLTIRTVRNLIKHWWFMMLAGGILIGLGIWVISSPFQSYLSLSFAFAAGIFGAGILEVFFSVVNQKSMKGWGWALAGGLVDIFIGSYLFYYPLITMLVLPLIIGFWMLFRGMMAIGNALEIRYHGFWDWSWLMLTGIIIVLLALIILFDPAFGMMNIIIWTGLAFIVSGIFRIYLSLKIRQLGHRLNNEL